MLDMELYILLKGIIEAQEQYFGIPLVAGQPGIPVAQNFQPTQQGVPNRACAFINIIGHKRVGQPGRVDFYDDEDEVEVHEETQVMITRFQLSALATQSETSLTQYTAADIINYMAMILQNSTTIAQLEAVGCGMLLDFETRNPKFMDDRARFEASPSLDFGITHKLIVRKEVPVLQSTELDIYWV